MMRASGRAGALIGWLLLGSAAPPARAPAVAPAGRIALGQYGGWGAFADPGEGRCFAIAEPISIRPRGSAPALAVARWRRIAGPSQIHARLSRASAAAVLTAGGRRFALRVVGRDAWASGDGDDRRIVAAMRGGGMIAIAGRDAAGRRFRDLYPTAGAASAIDAARVRCIGD